MDFTPDQYQTLLQALIQSNIPYTLRHDVDAKPRHALRIAQLEQAAGIKSIYYFRHRPHGWDEEVIRAVAASGHRIGYHYESLVTCRGNLAEAYTDFCRNLESLRRIVPVTTVCMHGSPHSRYDSRTMWQTYDYRRLGIDYEPYLDTDFDQTLYLTDTGRRWDGWRYSVRDIIESHQSRWQQQGLTFRSSEDLVGALLDPNSILRQSGYGLLLTTHPQRWVPFGAEWCMEWAGQAIKNQIKRVVKRSVASSQ